MRESFAHSIECIEFGWMFHKNATQRRKKKLGPPAPPPTWTNKYYRAFVCRISLNQSLPHLGRDLSVKVRRNHNLMANELFGLQALERFYQCVIMCALKHAVVCLMLDGNMCLCCEAATG